MIFDVTKDNTINENTIESILEGVEDRFEYETMSEATAIVVAEQEANWGRFMEGVGMSELATIMEGQEVIYEGARLNKFLETARGFFEHAIKKLGEITKSFINKVKSLGMDNSAFLKKHKTELLNASAGDMKFNGYKFENLKEASYDIKNIKVTEANAKSRLSNKEEFSKEAAQKDVCKVEGNFAAGVHKHLFGEKSEFAVNISAQVKILEDTNGMRAAAQKAYGDAKKEIKGIINSLKTEKGEATKEMQDAISMVISYYKSVSNAILVYHGVYLSALGARNSQAKHICAKVLRSSAKKVEDKKPEDTKKLTAKTEGFVDAGAFLGAVEFI